jgi:hypothetical protein
MGALPPNEALKLTAWHGESALGRSLAPVFDGPERGVTWIGLGTSGPA